MSLLNWTASPVRPSRPEWGEASSGKPGREAWREAWNGEGIRFRPGLFESCANPACRSGWLHLWRSRSVPMFESGWTCSAECTCARVRSAASRELDGRGVEREGRPHRIPIGLLMLEQGWITEVQLRLAIDSQKSAGTGRLGQWLIRQRAVDETMVTRALGLQWSCPVMPLEFHDGAAFTAVMPRLFLDAFGTLPLRLAAGRLLYLGFDGCLDPVLALAIERMSGLRVESGVVQGSQFRSAHARMLEAKFPALELVEAASEPAAADALSHSVERARPVASRLVRVHQCLWLRMWLRVQRNPIPEAASIRDVVCTLGIHSQSGILR